MENKVFSCCKRWTSYKHYWGIIKSNNDCQPAHVVLIVFQKSLSTYSLLVVFFMAATVSQRIPQQQQNNSNHPKRETTQKLHYFLPKLSLGLLVAISSASGRGGGSGHCNIIRLNSCYDFDLTQVRVSLSSGRMCTHRWGFHWLRKLKPEDSSNPENSIQGFWWFCIYSDEWTGPYLTSYLTWVILS